MSPVWTCMGYSATMTIRKPFIQLFLQLHSRSQNKCIIRKRRMCMCWGLWIRTGLCSSIRTCRSFTIICTDVASSECFMNVTHLHLMFATSSFIMRCLLFTVSPNSGRLAPLPAFPQTSNGRDVYVYMYLYNVHEWVSAKLKKISRAQNTCTPHSYSHACSYWTLNLVIFSCWEFPMKT